jgi:hypothetical protein
MKEGISLYARFQNKGVRFVKRRSGHRRMPGTQLFRPPQKPVIVKVKTLFALFPTT